MSATLDAPRAGRVPGSLKPQLFDTINYVYPDDVTVIEIYSYKGDGESYATGMITYTYTDGTHLRILKVTRSNCE